jgi:basic membrane lipoprotein Med (substrate-binding protein (PBP1-ABC) superfamily)
MAHSKVALLTPGPVSDAGWNAGAYEGLLRIRDSLGAQISQVETKTPAEFDEAFRDYTASARDSIVAGTLRVPRVEFARDTITAPPG